MASKELFRLLNILDQRDIGLSKEDVAPAFESSDRSENTIRWMQEYLGSATLLTKEELSFAEKRVPHDKEVRSSVHPVSDTEIKAAISSIEASTAAIEKQTRRLQAQKQALIQLKTSNNKNGSSTLARTDRAQRTQREKAQLDLEVNEIAQNLDIHLQSSRKQADSSVKALSSNIERLLDKDDRLLDGLGKLIPRIIDVDASSTSKTSVDQINQLCEVLTHLAQLSVQHRVDNIYRTALASYTQSPGGDLSRPDEEIDEGEIANEISLIRAELAELTGEIPSLLPLVIDSQYRMPLVRKMQASQSQTDLERAQWSDYLLTTMEFLTTRLDVTGEHLQGLKAHRDALASIAGYLHPELLSLHELAKNGAAAQKQIHNSPAKDSRKGLRPLMLLSRSHDGQDPALSLLRHLGVPNLEGMDETKLTRALKAAVSENKEQQRNLATSTEDGINKMLSESLAKGDKDVEDLLSVVYAYSPFATLKTVDGSMQAELDSLQHKIESLGLEVRQLDTDGISREIRAHQKHLQASWQG